MSNWFFVGSGGSTPQWRFASTIGTTVQNEPVNVSNLSIKQIDSTRYICWWFTNTALKMNVLTVSGTTITTGTTYSYTVNTAIAFINMDVIDSTRILITYHNSSTIYAEAMIVSVSGSTLTFNTPAQFGAITSYFSFVFKYNSTEGFWFGGDDISNAEYKLGSHFTYSGTTITPVNPSPEISAHFPTIANNSDAISLPGQNQAIAILTRSQATPRVDPYVFVFTNDGGSTSYVAQTTSTMGTDIWRNIDLDYIAGTRVFASFWGQTVTNTTYWFGDIDASIALSSQTMTPLTLTAETLYTTCAPDSSTGLGLTVNNSNQVIAHIFDLVGGSPPSYNSGVLLQDFTAAVYEMDAIGIDSNTAICVKNIAHSGGGRDIVAQLLIKS